MAARTVHDSYLYSFASRLAVMFEAIRPLNGLFASANFPRHIPSSKPPRKRGRRADKHCDNGTTPGTPRSAETLVRTHVCRKASPSPHPQKQDRAEPYSPDPPLVIDAASQQRGRVRRGPYGRTVGGETWPGPAKSPITRWASARFSRGLRRWGRDLRGFFTEWTWAMLPVY